jgi:hypothetical protein
VTITCSFRILTHQIDICGPAQQIRLVHSFFGNSAEQDAPRRYQLGYAIRRAGREHEVLEDGGLVGSAGSADALLALLGLRLRLRIFDYLSRAGWLLIDGGIVTVAGRRLLIAGEPAPGARAAAAGHLVTAGELVEGADSVAVRAGQAIAVPFPVRLGPGRPGLDLSRLQPGLRLRLAPVGAICALAGRRLTPLAPHEAIGAVGAAQRRPYILARPEVARQVLLLSAGGPAVTPARVTASTTP